ncbi:YueI family protein [Carnobacterium gallinarum]|uniref:YueI family protein n=1 Tax=Carnobacterium gallinarum TaxID=2749 RepID=UPI000555BBC0|nr:YueI family protein [Carnobacterium gallinarum]
MSEKELEDRLSSGLYGAPQIKPEERNKFLGSLRERVYLSMTIEELSSHNYLDALEAEFKKHPSGQVLLNGEVDNRILGPYLKLCSGDSIKFTIVTNQFAKQSSIGLLYVAENAVNESCIDVAEKYPAPDSSECDTKTADKKTFFKRFFS